MLRLSWTAPRLVGLAGLFLGLPGLVAAQPAAGSSSGTVSEVVVTARRLDAARDTIQPRVGASTYAFSAKTIQALPGGSNAQLNQVILQAPGVTQDSYGQLHVRGEHNGLQFRLNGVILPEGLSVFSQALNPRLAGRVELITGALPAEYGLRTAGVVDITTRSGDTNGGSVSLYGGSHGEFEPSFEISRSSGATNLFVSASWLQNDLGIESPDGRSDPLHDHTEQFQGFAYVEHVLNDKTRVSAIFGSSDQRFQIPNVAGGLNGGFGYVVDGQSDYPSGALNENQTENTQYGVISLLRADERLTTQVSAFARYSTLNFMPDPLGDLLYQGIAQHAAKSDVAGGVQAEAAYHLGASHTLRGGVIVEIDRASSAATAQVLPVDAAGVQTGGPLTIVDNSARIAETYSAYLQDEWRLLDNLTLNYGLRFDQFNGFRSENQLSPRANLVWKATPTTTVHIGYARYFSPPPFELVGGETITRFAGTSAAPTVTEDVTPFAERADYYDIGLAQKVSADVTVTFDSYYKRSSHLVDEGQFGAPIILTPFNYKDGLQYGLELTFSYDRGPFSAYANLSHAIAQGRDWDSSQFNFDAPSIAYVRAHDIYLDHDQAYSVSAGASYLWRGTRLSGDFIYGSGLRADRPLAASPAVYPGLTAIPNGEELPGYAQVNLSLSHRFDHVPTGPIEVRLDVINALDAKYQIRNGTGVGVFAPQYGARRGVFGGVTKDF